MAALNAPPRAVLFDLGGVLVDWDPRRLYRKLLSDEAEVERFLAEVCTMDWHGAHDAGTPMADNAPALIARFPHYEAEILAWNARWPEMFDGEIDGVAAVIERLDDAQIPVYALSNLPAEKWGHIQETYPVTRRFRDVIVSGEEGVKKPDRRIFDITAQRLGVAPGDVVFFDDLQTNVDAACAYGFDAVLFESAAGMRNALSARGLGDVFATDEAL